MSRLARAFDEPTLVGYLVGAHPSPEVFLDHAARLIEGGCGVLEVGIPFSDPIADGPTIQAAVADTLARGVRPADVLALCKELRARYPETALVVMTYTNLAYCVGYSTFADRLRDAGVDGAILADLPPEAAGEVRAAFADDLDLVFLASPATSQPRLDLLLDATRGFLYVVGLFGVTGARDTLDPRTVALVERIVPAAEKAGKPIAVGFGVSKGDQAEALVRAGAHGVVVGSAFVKRASEGASAQEMGALARELAEGVARGRR